MIATFASLGLGTYYLAYYACYLGGLLGLVLLVRVFKDRLPRHVGVATALFVGVSLARLVLFDNPFMLRAYQHSLTVDTLGMRQTGVLDLEVRKYRRDIHQRALPNLAVGSSQVGAIFYHWVSDPPQPLEVYALAGMKALDFVLNEEAIAARNPARVILYLSAFDMTGSPELFSLPLAPPQPLAMWSIYSRLRAVGLTEAETAPSLHAYVGSQLLPEYRYSFVYRALLRKWMNAAPRPEPAPGQRFTDRVTYWDPQWLDYNFSFLDEFLRFCEARGIEVVVAEGQIDPAAITPAIAGLNRTVRSRITGLRARFPTLHYVPAVDVYEFTSADYRDTTHVVPDAARRYTARFSEYLRTRLNPTRP